MTKTPTLISGDDDRHDENVFGQFWVNDECIDCGMCYEIASNFFRRSEDGSQAVVFKQPESDAEIETANEALTECPVEAIQAE